MSIVIGQLALKISRLISSDEYHINWQSKAKKTNLSIGIKRLTVVSIK